LGRKPAEAGEGDQKLVLHQHRQGRSQQCSYDFMMLVTLCRQVVFPSNSGPPQSKRNPTLREARTPAAQQLKQHKIYSLSVFLLLLCLIKAVLLAICHRAFPTDTQKAACTGSLPPHPPPGAEQDTTVFALLI